MESTDERKTNLFVTATKENHDLFIKWNNKIDKSLEAYQERNDLVQSTVIKSIIYTSLIRESCGKLLESETSLL